MASNSQQSTTGKPPTASPPPTVTFGRRTSSGRFISYSRDSMDSDLSGEFTNYHVHFPPTPDNQPMVEMSMDPSMTSKVEEQYVSSSLFTGGFNNVTRAHVMDKVIESESEGDNEKRKGLTCAVPGCDAKAMPDVAPCECDYRICADCFVEAANGGGGLCPGCKEPFRITDLNELLTTGGKGGRPLPLPPPNTGAPKMERRLSLMKSKLSRTTTTGEFDHNRWLFETKGTYGYGNAIWPDENDGGGGGGHSQPTELMTKPWRPLTRKLRIPAAVLSPYRLLIVIRMVALAMFLTWRIKHKNEDAIWLWGMSVVCELWFAFSWLLDQLPKLNPVNRTTDLKILKEKFETPGPHNPMGKSDLPGVDVFVSTADPEKEPPLVTANTILSILATDYPVEKLACYVSDDGGALLTFEAMAEASSFADLWIPFRIHPTPFRCLPCPRGDQGYERPEGDGNR